jgi:hypothetical protein
MEQPFGDDFGDDCESSEASGQVRMGSRVRHGRGMTILTWVATILGYGHSLR